MNISQDMAENLLTLLRNARTRLTAISVSGEDALLALGESLRAVRIAGDFIEVQLKAASQQNSEKDSEKTDKKIVDPVSVRGEIGDPGPDA